MAELPIRHTETMSKIREFLASPEFIEPGSMPLEDWNLAIPEAADVESLLGLFPPPKSSKI